MQAFNELNQQQETKAVKKGQIQHQYKGTETLVKYRKSFVEKVRRSQDINVLLQNQSKTSFIENIKKIKMIQFLLRRKV
jgi:hypothetical protein